MQVGHYLLGCSRSNEGDRIYRWGRRWVKYNLTLAFSWSDTSCRKWWGGTSHPASIQNGIHSAGAGNYQTATNKSQVPSFPLATHLLFHVSPPHFHFRCWPWDRGALPSTKALLLLSCFTHHHHGNHCHPSQDQQFKETTVIHDKWTKIKFWTVNTCHELVSTHIFARRWIVLTLYLRVGIFCSELVHKIISLSQNTNHHQTYNVIDVSLLGLDSLSHNSCLSINQCLCIVIRSTHLSWLSWQKNPLTPIAPLCEQYSSLKKKIC